MKGYLWQQIRCLFDVSSIMISYKIRVKFLVDMTYMKFQSRLR